ncbi:MAG: hypothetical protein SGBAC_003668 [Bacillariaceae sp.]
MDTPNTNATGWGEPPFSFASKETICKDGSLTVIFVILFFATVFVTKQILYRRHQADLAKRNQKIHGIVKEYGEGGSLREWFAHEMEEIFIKPFIPTSLEDMITTLYICWFLFTITMAVTRFYKEQWANEAFAQHGPFNFMSWSIGCETMNITALSYTNKLPDLLPAANRPGLFRTFLKFKGRKRLTAADGQRALEKDYFEVIDWHFTIHLMFASVWLTVGFLQIVWTRTGWSMNKSIRRNAHRMFGRFAVLSFLVHMCGAILIVSRNPVKQVLPIVLFYWTDIADILIQAILGLRWAVVAKRIRESKKSNESIEGEDEDQKLEEELANDENYQSAKNMHQFRMVTVYLKSTFGSGAIRLMVWLMWLVGKFVSFETRIIIDRSTCQSFSKELGSDMVGQADKCMRPVFFNLALTDMLVLWLEWLFVCVLAQETKKVTAVDVNMIKIKLQQTVLACILYGVMIWFDNSWASTAIIFFAILTKFQALHELIAILITKPQVGGVNQRNRNSSVLRSSLMTIHGGEFEAEERFSDYPSEEPAPEHLHQD